MVNSARIFIALIAFWGLSCGPLEAREAALPPVLAGLIEEALANNPDLRAAEARWQLYRHRIGAAGALDDPFLSFSLNNYPVDSFKGNETPMSGKVIKLSQNLPFPGKLAAQEELAGQQALWYKNAYEDNRLQLIRMVKDAYFTLFYYEKAVGITEKKLKLLDDFVRLTETNYEVGRGLQQDVLRAQVENSRLIDTLYGLRQQRESALAGLNSLLNRPTATTVGPLAEFEMQSVSMSLEEIKQQAVARRPLYAAYNSLIERYRLQRKLARLNYRPDFKVGLAYTVREPNPGDDGTDFVGIEFGVNLPLFRDKRDAAVAEADSSVRMAMEQFKDFQARVNFNLHDAYVQMQKNHDQAALYKTGIIPQASQSYEAALSAYQVGKVSFLTLIDNLMTLYRYEIDYYRVLTEVQRNIARLEAESGLMFGPQ